MFSNAPKWATFITFGLPAMFLVATGVTWLIPATHTVGTSFLALLIAGGWVFLSLFLNAVFSQIAGAIARRKGQRFSAFYLPGLLLTFVAPLIIALAIKSQSTA
jgi:MFS family permease